MKLNLSATWWINYMTKRLHPHYCVFILKWSFKSKISTQTSILTLFQSETHDRMTIHNSFMSITHACTSANRKQRVGCSICRKFCDY